MHTFNLRLAGICYLCRHGHRGKSSICPSCIAKIETLGPACDYCAHPLPGTLPNICGNCCKQRPLVDRVITHYRFSEPLRTLIHAFKYDSALFLKSCLTELMLEARPLDYISDCLIPVPLHRRKLMHRGFNQSSLLAKALSKILNIKVQHDVCKKIIDSPAQANLSASDRIRNLKQAFQSNPLSYEHVCLIDDVYTTGATANALALVLKEQGVKRVDLWCCARTCFS